MIKTIFFDLGNVLLYFSLPKMVQQLSQVCGIPIPKLQTILVPLREQYETGQIDTESLYQTFLTHSTKPYSLSEFVHAISNIFTPNTDLWPLVEQLKANGIRLVLLSNTCECHFTYIATNYPILQLFDHSVLSYEVAAWKPDPRIFQNALQHSQCKPEECFYTDDIPEFIQAAKTNGLDGETFTTADALKTALIARGCNFLAS
jgi:putative hydrolase of the HAD superfamily